MTERARTVGYMSREKDGNCNHQPVLGKRQRQHSDTFVLAIRL